jgi:hypothetical protein
MKYFVILFCLLTIALPASAQQTYDLLTFTPPPGWNQTNLENAISFSTTDNVARTWAQISIIKSTASKGNMDADFKSEWKDLAVTPYGVSAEPLSMERQVFNGWNFWTGMGQFNFNGETASLLLNTFSDNERCISFILMSNTKSYGPVLDNFIGSISIPKKERPAEVKTSPVTKVSTPVADGFYFTTTNFDDGWVSVVKEDWVEATKGNIRVLVHYPRKEDSEYISQQVDRTKRFWDLLVAPRYVSASDFFFYEYNMSFEPAHFASAVLTDKQGTRNFVALFQKAKSAWIEVITPDKDTFVRTFGVDRPDSYFDQWDKLFNLSGLNKFAVHENDLKGKWTSDFSSSMQYYSAYTGLYAGYNAYHSNEFFNFGANKSYHWKIFTANNVNGQTATQSAESSGTFSTIGNWQVKFSKIQDRPKTYNAYFSCIKGGRVLWMQDVEYGGYNAYGKASQ